MNNETIRRKYIKESLPWLLKKAQQVCNEYIRKRDNQMPCASCGKYKELEAGHIFHASECSGLRFDEYNILGECKHCNYYRSDHVINLLSTAKKRFGEDKVNELLMKRDWLKRNGHKWDKFTLIETIINYKKKINQLN